MCSASLRPSIPQAVPPSRSPANIFTRKPLSHANCTTKLHHAPTQLLLSLHLRYLHTSAFSHHYSVLPLSSFLLLLCSFVLSTLSMPSTPQQTVHPDCFEEGACPRRDLWGSKEARASEQAGNFCSLRYLLNTIINYAAHIPDR